MELVVILLVLLATLGGEIRLYRKHGLTGLSYGCDFSVCQVTEGDMVELTETIENAKLLPMPWLKAELTVPKWLQFSDAHSTVTGDVRFVTGFFSLRGNTRVNRVWQVTCTKRGVYHVAKGSLVTADLLGAVRLSLPAQHTGRTLTVLPRRFTAAGAILPSFFCREMGWQSVRHSLYTDPCLPAGVREYQPGDSVRQIHWKISAHRNELFVRQPEQTAQQTMTVLLLLETSPTDSGTMTWDDVQMEHGIRVCAQCLWELSRAGWQVRLCVGEEDECHNLRETRCGGGAWMYHGAMELLASLPLKQIVSAARLLQYAGYPQHPVLLITPYTDQRIARWKAGSNSYVVVTGNSRDFGCCGDKIVAEDSGL